MTTAGPLDIANLPVLDDPCPADRSLSPFIVSTDRGFLPRLDPLRRLPSEFVALEEILEQMPIKLQSGEVGLLGLGQLAEVVDNKLPNFLQSVILYEDDLVVITALFRDYTFLASAYLLEPCHLRSMQGQDFGLGRSVLPPQIAQPLCFCAEIAGFKPYLEYAGSYVLSNFQLENPLRGIELDNLRLIRAFESGLLPDSSEAGFVKVHINMVKYSGPLVHGVVSALRATAGPGFTNDSRTAFNDGLFSIIGALKSINASMKHMYSRSRPSQFNNFRTFMFGIASESMFPNGVVYEGTNGNQPLFFRGETGANDSMIPLMDRFLGISMPDTPLTDILRDFDQYRPKNHRDFLQFVKEYALQCKIRESALCLPPRDDSSLMEEEERHLLGSTRNLWLQALDEVRLFRWRHWTLAKEYILKRSSHPTATGGSPIIAWLPNQLAAVLKEIIAISQAIEGQNDNELGPVCRDIIENAVNQLAVVKETLAEV